MNARDTILLQYEGLSDGTSLAGELCPACKGGDTREGSLSVSSTGGGIKWYCHRASCGFRGATNSSMRQSFLPTQQVQCRGVVGRTIARAADALDSSVAQVLWDKYSITERQRQASGLGWDVETQRLVLPVYNYHGDLLGSNLRALDGRQPKTKLHTEENAISWYVNHATPGVLIVEDQFSAIRASDFLTSVALLGTHLNDHRAEEILASGCTPVFLALDADAFAKAVGYTIQYRQQLHPILVKLSRDIKDMTHEELQELMNEQVLSKL